MMQNYLWAFFILTHTNINSWTLIKSFLTFPFIVSPTKWTSSTSEWRIAEQHNVEIAKIHQDSNIVSNSTLKHYETTGYVSFLQSSSIISSEVGSKKFKQKNSKL